MKKLLLGDEAIAQGALDAGLSGVYAYPGTPPLKLQSIFRCRHWQRSVVCIVVGRLTRRQRWRQHWACRTWESVLWFV